MASKKRDQALSGEVGGGLPEIEPGAEGVEHTAPALPPDAPLPEQQGPTMAPPATAMLHAAAVAQGSPIPRALRDGEDADDLFVSCVPEKGPVSRFGAGSSALIGARRDGSVESGMRYFPDRVVKIGGEEFRRYSREYERALREGALVRHGREQHDAYLERRVLERRQNAEAKAEQAAAKQDQPAEPAPTPTPTTGG